MKRTIACIACAEQILASAKLCKHCGTMQNDERFQSVPVPDDATDLVDEAIELFQGGNFAEGFALIADLIKAGEPNALANAGWAHHELGDDKTALKLLNPSAEAGHEGAMWSIVGILDIDGCTKSERAAYRSWLIKLSDLGNTGAMMYLYQDHLDYDEQGEALDWLNKAAVAGDADAVSELKTWKIRPVTVKLPKN